MTLTRRQENELAKLISILGETAGERLPDIDQATVGRVATVVYGELISLRARSPSNKGFEEGSIEKQLAGKLYLSIKRLRNIPAPNLDTWARAIDLMIRKDGRGVNEIKAVIEYIPLDGFWRTVILSATLLKKHFDKLAAKMAYHDSRPKPPGRAHEFFSEKKRRPIY